VGCQSPGISQVANGPFVSVTYRVKAGFHVPRRVSCLSPVTAKFLICVIAELSLLGLGGRTKALSNAPELHNMLPPIRKPGEQEEVACDARSYGRLARGQAAIPPMVYDLGEAGCAESDTPAPNDTWVEKATPDSGD
jgi:hypothetical protein